jgi:heme/copper-type cytochrome/quinol oxidase subunit 3
MEIPYTRTPRPDTGLFNAKIGIWVFLASEVMLFGGLFSSYIFLRVGADYHWPVHELKVLPGFINTLVLILSSVTVVMAWASLKMRKIAQYKACMWITIICAGIFMCLKAYEYYGKFTHYGVRMTDGTILTGHFPDEGYKVTFGDVNKVTLTLKTADPDYFLKWCESEKPKFKTDDGKEIELTSSSLKELSKAVADKAAQEKKDAPKSITLTPVSPLKFSVKPSKLFGYTEKSLTFRDNTVIEGKLISDKMTLQVDKVDVRSVVYPEKSLAWNYLGEEWKKEFQSYQKHGEDHYKGKFSTTDERYLRHVLQMEIHHPTVEQHRAAHGDSKHAEAHTPAEHKGDSHSHYPEVQIEKKDINFWSNFTPKWNTYYAIYFTLTGLHGMHVVAGALVLAWFLLFNTKMLQEDPEHLANRVEVGGLFWHFVDLVWIFLFPLLYLL